MKFHGMENCFNLHAFRVWLVDAHSVVVFRCDCRSANTVMHFPGVQLLHIWRVHDLRKILHENAECECIHVYIEQ